MRGLDRAVLLTVVFVLAVTSAAGVVAASQHDIDVAFSDGQVAPGQQVEVQMMADPANDPNADVGGYDVELVYDTDDLDFVDASDDTYSVLSTEPSDRTVAIFGDAQPAETVPVTLVTVTFEADSDAEEGANAVELNDANSAFTDSNDNPFTFESSDGTVTVDRQHVDLSFSDGEAAPDATVAVTLEADSSEDPGTNVASYDLEVQYDDTVLNFVGASDDAYGVTTSEPSDGTISLAGSTQPGEGVPTALATLEFETESDAAGETATIDLVERSVNVSSSDGRLSFASHAGSVDVVAEPNVTVLTTDLVTGATIGVEEAAVVDATLFNDGNAEGTRTAELRANGTAVDTTTVTVPADETRTVTLSTRFDAPGTYALAVDGRSVGTVTVAEEATPGDTDTPEDTETDTTTQASTDAPSPTEPDTATAGGNSSTGTGGGARPDEGGDSLLLVLLGILALLGVGAGLAGYFGTP